ncbi:MAG: NHL repeat-containing protein [Spartobacteria bacterium]
MKFKLAPTIAAGLLFLASLARADTFYLSNFGVNSITKYDDNGNGSSFTSTFVNGPNGLALDGQGNLYVSTNNNTIHKFAPNGADLGVFASTGLNNAMGLAFDKSGNLYAANFGGNTVEVFAADGTDLGVFANVVRPTGIAFDTTGRLYVANFGNTIERFAADGTPLGTFADTGLNNPEGLAFDSLGYLYAANNAANTIEVFGPDGTDFGSVAASGIDAPVGLAFDSAGSLYVVNAGSTIIEKITTSGSATIFAITDFQPTFLAIQRNSTPGDGTSTLVNISTRLNVLTGDNVLDGGFIITGTGTKRVLIRGLGPSLADSGVDGALADPLIELHSGTTGEIIMSNDNWKNNQQDEIAATGLAPTKDLEAALVITLAPAAYTVIERGKQATTGVGLIELYDLGAGVGPELANISTRGFVATQSNVMIAGFIVANSSGESDQVIVRGLGPSLGAFEITNPLTDPVLELHDINGTLLAINDDWKDTQQTEIESVGLQPTDDVEAALIMTLPPGAYTAIESGKDGGTGVGLVEVYNLH